MRLPIVLTSDGPVPLYLQIKYQVSYLITSGQLATGDKLPPIRQVAAALDVNPGTVAQAYRGLRQEGLIEAAVGRGTFVAPTFPPSQDSTVCRGEASRAIEGALDRLRALGLSDSDIRLQFEAVLAAKPLERQVLLAAPNEPVGLKYSASLNRRFGPVLKIHPVTYADLERRAPHVESLLDLCYFVVTFASSVRRVELALEPFGRPFRLLGMTTELLPRSIADLGRLATGSRALILSEERYAHQSLGLVLQHSPLVAADLQLLTLEDEGVGQTTPSRHGAAPNLRGPDTGTGGTAAAIANDRVLIHTFGAREHAQTLAPAATTTIELHFDVVEDSVARIRSILLPS